MTAEMISSWLGLLAFVVTGVVLWSARDAGVDRRWRRASRVAAIALVVELAVVVAAILIYLSFDDRGRF